MLGRRPPAAERSGWPPGVCAGGSSPIHDGLCSEAMAALPWKRRRAVLSGVAAARVCGGGLAPGQVFGRCWAAVGRCLAAACAWSGTTPRRRSRGGRRAWERSGPVRGVERVGRAGDALATLASRATFGVEDQQHRHERQSAKRSVFPPRIFVEDGLFGEHVTVTPARDASAEVERLLGMYLDKQQAALTSKV
jgi:hypothetical protein